MRKKYSTSASETLQSDTKVCPLRICDAITDHRIGRCALDQTRIGNFRIADKPIGTLVILP